MKSEKYTRIKKIIELLCAKTERREVTLTKATPMTMSSYYEGGVSSYSVLIPFNALIRTIYNRHSRMMRERR